MPCIAPASTPSPFERSTDLDLDPARAHELVGDFRISLFV
jgi:hypothetical protein